MPPNCIDILRNERVTDCGVSVTFDGNPPLSSRFKGRRNDRLGSWLCENVLKGALVRPDLSDVRTIRHLAPVWGVFFPQGLLMVPVRSPHFVFKVGGVMAQRIRLPSSTRSSKG
jgi:hypothetical protein